MNPSPDNSTAVQAPHHLPDKQVLAALGSSPHGLSLSEVAALAVRHGPNRLPQAEPPGITLLLLSQFKSPLIYVLLAAAMLSLAIGKYSDAGFIFAVLIINALIGTLQEFSAQRAASALQNMVSTESKVQREGETYVVDAETLVPGDLVLLETGDRVAADLRLLEAHDLEIDESALTGESLPTRKQAEALLAADTTLGDRVNMAFAGTLVNRGRGLGVVTHSGRNTELGRIAEDVVAKPAPRAPLVVRMEAFTHRIALFIGVAALVTAGIGFSRGIPLSEILLLAVALAVSAIPEGLPVALTVALAISMQRMTRRQVIIRRLVAVESLGSCTFIATDKTGTLTVNQLTATRLWLPGEQPWQITGGGLEPEGAIIPPQGTLVAAQQALLEQTCLAAALPNDGFLGRRDQHWEQHGDAVDVALLVMAHKAGIIRAEALQRYPEVDSLPFESERQFSASLHLDGNRQLAFVKGAAEKVVDMCSRTLTATGPAPLDRDACLEQAETLAAQGFRVLALASGEIRLGDNQVFSAEHLSGLMFHGLVGMIDPLRPEARPAIARCQSAGIEVAMVTGDHPATAAAIGRELQLGEQIVTGHQLRQADSPQTIDQLTREARIFARIEPHQKLGIVHSLQRNGHFVAMSGDGANDAPALRAAHVGVAMGKSGTDVARETADIIITDDNFSSMVAGVEEGRIAYANVRKVIFLLISTGAAEIVLFTLALLTGLPLPLVAVQLLWLNLVTNGIQHIALAFEPGEGHELQQPPRAPNEPIFNRLMIERTLISALIIGGVAYALFRTLLMQGYSLEEARNGTLLLMVLFENMHVFNSRSETLSVFQHSPLRNRILLFGTLVAQLIHIGAMYTPWLSEVLRIQPVSPTHWLELLGLATTVLIGMELHKFLRRRIPALLQY